ncbi:Lrp/AsnC family transcriptional regulator [Oceanicella sp. SM1341]|uniref:Lrp/AsnC family transcriptional regulator n=1 Tax=Oceanicella sp. SM1341 TaxID=1548889 RepID=UPI000E4A0797|nr:Lrp/AsnC family transcriptional regulator [Oceanicella sp. SM1341]
MKDVKLDRIDRKILSHLMRDATVSIAKLASLVGLSQTPCWRRVQKLEDAGFIIGRVALVDPSKIGLGLTAFVEIEAPEHTTDWRAALQEATLQFPPIVEVHRMAGEADYILKVIVPDMDAFDRFCTAFSKALPCRTINSRFSLETVRTSTAWPIDLEGR